MSRRDLNLFISNRLQRDFRSIRKALGDDVLLQYKECTLDELIDLLTERLYSTKNKRDKNVCLLILHKAERLRQ